MDEQCCRVGPYLIKAAPLRSAARHRSLRAAALGPTYRGGPGTHAPVHRSDWLTGSPDELGRLPSSSACQCLSRGH
jgi:hypothetical protein